MQKQEEKKKTFSETITQKFGSEGKINAVHKPQGIMGWCAVRINQLIKYNDNFESK